MRTSSVRSKLRVSFVNLHVVARWALLAIGVSLSGVASAQNVSATRVYTGGDNTCALTTASGLKCWGANSQGATGQTFLGTGPTSGNVLTPTDVTELTSGISAAAFSGAIQCVVRSGVLSCRGANNAYQLARTTLSSFLPLGTVTGISDVASVSIGERVVCALTTSGAAYCWGLILGSGSAPATDQYRASPTIVAGLESGVRAVSVGSFPGGAYRCFVTAAGGVKCIGRRAFSGGGSDGTDTLIDVPGLTSGVASVSVGYEHSCAVTTAGGVKCWGGNQFGQLGNGNPGLTGGPNPVDVTGLTSGVASVSAGEYSTCAVLTTGAVRCWGYNQAGRLGDGTTTNRSTPVNVAGLASGVASVSMRNGHTCAVKTNGSVDCWGQNSNGQLGDGTTASRTTALSALTAQTITWPPITGVEFGWGKLVLMNATASSGLPLTYSNSPGSTCLAGVAGLTTQFQTTGAGTCTITATQAGNATFASVTATQTFTIAKAQQTINFPAIANRNLGSTTQANTGSMTASVLSGRAVLFSSQTPTVCTTDGITTMTYTSGSCSTGNPVGCGISNSNFTVLTAGTCTIRATHDGNADYAAAAPVDRSFSISIPGAPTITFAQPGPFTWQSNSGFQLAASSTSTASPVTFTSLTTAICTVNGASVVFLSAGTCTIRASQAASGTTPAAADVTRDIVINKANQSISHSSDAPSPLYIDRGTLRFTNSASSGLTVTSTVMTPSVCALTGPDQVALLNLGICEVHFSQAGNINFNAATTVQRGYTIQSRPQITVPVQRISLGYGHSCSLTDFGGVRCWGRNDFGQLGDGTFINRASAVDVVGLYRGYVSVWTGAFHSCALSSTGGVRCWGLNNAGQLGDGTTISRVTPVDVFGMISGIAGIAAGERSTCAITLFGALRCWGFNGFGQLGDGTLINRLIPTDVVGLSGGVARIAMGLGHACVLTSAGGLKCWGDNSSGQLGDGTTTARLTAVDVLGLTSGLTNFALGALHSCALGTNGGLRCWGSNADGRLGDGTTINRLTAVNVAGLLSGITNLSLGVGHSCALTSSGGLKCWGLNTDGRLGDGTTISRLTPIDVSGLLSGIVALAAGQGNSCGINSAGALQCWGSNLYGQIGDGSFVSRLVATAVRFSLAAGSAPQAINFPIIVSQALTTGATLNLAALSNSGLALAYASLTPNICTVAGNVLSMLGLGTCTVRATQAGDSIFSAAVPVDRSFAIMAPAALAPTTVTLSSSRGTAVLGQSILLTATVTATGAAPTGTVSFVDATPGATGVNMCVSVPLAGNFATCVVPAVNRALGTRNWRANYSGDARTAASNNVVSQAITPSNVSVVVTSLPVRPSAGQNVTITAQLNLSAGITNLGAVSFTRNGSAISGCTNVAARALTGSSTSAVATCTINAISAGTNAIAVSYSGDTSNGVGDSALALSVAASGPLDYSDLWWAGETENGWGLTIMQKGSTQFNAFYVYGSDGRPVWYVMPGGSWNTDFTVFTGALYQPSSGQLGAYDTTRFSAGSSVGTATLTFSSISKARFDYTINGVSGSKQIERQAFGVADPAPRINAMDLWWGGSFENGWGFALAQQERTIFGVWFTYDTNGQGTWLVMPGGTWNGSTYTGDLYTTTSSPWLGVTYDRSKITVNNVGSVSLAFSDADNATMTYTINGATQVKEISRQPF